jgi:Arc/MetJ family transcription regulator
VKNGARGLARPRSFVYEELEHYTQETAMRTNVEIDEALIERVMDATGLPTKRAAVDAGLRALLRLEEQKEILSLAGQVRWEGDLDAMREGRAGETDEARGAREA